MGHAHRLATGEGAVRLAGRLVAVVIDRHAAPNAVQRLNIQLYRHTKTTRPNRQVVWLVGLLAFAILGLAWRFSTLWFTRDSLLQAAPDSTALAVELQLNQRTWPVIEPWLGSIPLISNRSLDLHDLVPLTKGGLAVFVGEDGSRSVAIRGAIDPTAQARLKSANIWIQEVKPGILLLSETLVPVSGIESRTRPSFFPSSAAWLGRIELPDANLSGSLLESGRALAISFPTGKKAKSGSTLPDGILTMLVGADGLDGLLDGFATGEVAIFVEKDKNGATQTLIASRNSSWNEATLTERLQEIGAYLSPKIEKNVLQDGTVAQVLLIEPSLVPIQQVSVAGHMLLRASGENNEVIYGGSIDGTTILATGETIIQSFFAQPAESCTGNTASLQPGDLLDQTNIDSYQPLFSTLYQIIQGFSAISIESSKYSTNVILCRI